MAAETQTYLDEAKAPSIIGGGELRTAVKAFAGKVKEARQQVALLEGLLQDAEIAETDETVRGKFEIVVQQLGAMHRVEAKLFQDLRDLHQAMRGFKEADDDLRAVASEAGFTV